MDAVPVWLPWLLLGVSLSAAIWLQWHFRRQAAAREKQAEARLVTAQTTLQSIGDGVITTDMEGCVVLMNPAAEKLSGWKQSEAKGCLWQEVLPLLDEPSRRPLENPPLRLLRTGDKPRAVQPGLLVAADGTERFIAENSAFIRTGTGGVAGVVQVLRDVTEERKRAAEAARAGKLESLGLLAGGMAHDFNNLLTALAGNISLAREEAGLSPYLSERLEEMDRIVRRAGDLTKNLNTFAKGGTPRKSPVPLDGLIRETARLALQGTGHELSCELSADLPPVEADESQIAQVMHNLVLNAAQAMTRIGKVSIAAKNLDAGDDPRIRPGERWIKISVVDNGPGISPEVLPKIFDPFFTTKPKRTGLGLATCHNIIESHGGILRVESTIGRGTTFLILLPAIASGRP